MWSRNTLDLRGGETLVLPRVDTGSSNVSTLTALKGLLWSQTGKNKTAEASLWPWLAAFFRQWYLRPFKLFPSGLVVDANALNRIAITT